MIDYIKGTIIELSPTELILECGGIGYSILISLQTYEKSVFRKSVKTRTAGAVRVLLLRILLACVIIAPSNRNQRSCSSI